MKPANKHKTKKTKPIPAVPGMKKLLSVLYLLIINAKIVNINPVTVTDPNKYMKRPVSKSVFLVSESYLLINIVVKTDINAKEIKNEQMNIAPRV